MSIILHFTLCSSVSFLALPYPFTLCLEYLHTLYHSLLLHSLSIFHFLCPSPAPSLLLSHSCLQTKMGCEAGRGLGREGQGIIEPIKESSQRNRAGLGAARIAELEASDVQWEQEEVWCVCVRVCVCVCIRVCVCVCVCALGGCYTLYFTCVTLE